MLTSALVTRCDSGRGCGRGVWAPGRTGEGADDSYGCHRHGEDWVWGVLIRDQYLEAQHDASTAAGCEQIFINEASGTLTSRPERAKALLSANRAGDQDGPARPVAAVGRVFVSVIGPIAEFNSLMSGRTRDGLAAARAQGHTGGQKPELGSRQVTLAQATNYETGADRKRVHSRSDRSGFGVIRPTIYRHRAETHMVGDLWRVPSAVPFGDHVRTFPAAVQGCRAPRPGLSRGSLLSRCWGR